MQVNIDKKTQINRNQYSHLGFILEFFVNFEYEDMTSTSPWVLVPFKWSICKIFFSRKYRGDRFKTVTISIIFLTIKEYTVGKIIWFSNEINRPLFRVCKFKFCKTLLAYDVITIDQMNHFKRIIESIPTRILLTQSVRGDWRNVWLR